MFDLAYFSRRVAEYAFEYAINNGRSTVTAVHKGNFTQAAKLIFF